MKPTLALLLCLLFTSCAGTRFYDRRTGKLVASFQGDMIGSKYRDGATSWDVESVSHSTATRAGTDAITKTGTALGGVALGLAMKGVK